MAWIDASVAPPGDGDVLLTCDHLGCYFLATYFDGKWDTVDMKPINVAYWMELPQCPPAAFEDLDVEFLAEPFKPLPPLNGDMRAWAQELFRKQT